MILIAEQEGNVDVINIGDQHGVKGIGFSLRKATERYTSKAYEVAIDATYGTNQWNMELVSLLTESDGVGFPLGYVLLSSTDEITELQRFKQQQNSF